jgi:hypothetical protein
MIALVSILLVGTLPIKGWPIALMLLSTLNLSLISPLAVVVAEALEDSDVSNCRALNVQSWLWSFWVVFLVFECLLCYLAISKVYERIKPQSPYARDSIRNVLLRDSALYYISCVFLFVDLGVSISTQEQDRGNLFHQLVFLDTRPS